MTAKILYEIAKENKINLNWYDHVHSYINDNYTFIFIKFFQMEVVGGYRRMCNVKTIRKRVSNITIKGDYIPEDYETNGWEWIYEIKMK